MNRSLKIVFVILLAFIVLSTAAVGVLWMVNQRNQNADSNTNTAPPAGKTTDVTNVNANVDVPAANSNSNANTSGELPSGETQQPTASNASEEEELETLGLSFAERFGSFSNQSDFENIVSLKSYMTSDMQEWADDYVEDGRASSADTTVYYGVTTKSVAAEKVSLDSGGGTAEYTISTQRHEVDDKNSTDRTFEQDLRLNFEKVDDAWKVDEAKWIES